MKSPVPKRKALFSGSRLPVRVIAILSILCMTTGQPYSGSPSWMPGGEGIGVSGSAKTGL